MSETVAVIPKNKKEELRVTLDQFNGHDLFSCRVWFDAGDGEMRPSKSGVAFRVTLLPEFADAVHLAKARATLLGLLK